MAVGRITKRSVEAIPVPTLKGGHSFLWDDRLKGFGVVVTSKGVITAKLQYRIGGREAVTQRATIGRIGSPWTVEQARARAEELLELVRRKINPITADRERLAREAGSRADATRHAFGLVADAFVSHCRSRKLRSADDIEAVFRRDLKPYFGDKPLPSIRRADVHERLGAIGERSQSGANKAHSWLRTMLSWAVDCGRYGITASPMSEMSAPFASVKRKRVLRAAELVQVWHAASALGAPSGVLVQLLMLTGQRLREVAGMQWGEVDLGAGTWCIPGERTKNGLDHLCPLPAGAVAVLKAVEPDDKLRAGPVLTTNGTVSISGFSKAKSRIDALVAQPLPAWTFHDLRRSLATGLQSLGIAVEVTEAVLNHISGKRGGLVATYQTHDYWPEKVVALAAWDRHVSALISPPPEISNVVSISGRA